MITKADMQKVHQQFTEEGRRKMGDPPTADRLLAYTRGELSPAEEEDVRERLVHYPELARMAAEPFPSEGAEPGDPDFLSEHELARHWASLQKRRVPRPQPVPVPQFWRTTAAIAAALALVFGGMLLKVWSDAGSARAGWEEVMLSPDGQRGPSSDGITLSGKGNSYGIVAPVGDAPEFDDYRMEIVDAGGKRVWSQPMPGRGDSDTLSIIIPRKFLKPGKHQVVLYGVDGSREEKLTTYSLIVPRH